MDAPLAGLKVLELARILAGPWAGQMLSDLGAEVIKVESPEGDDTRRWGPPFIDRGGARDAAYFHGCNRGKRSVRADFNDPGDLALVRDLARDADVVIENFRVGGLARFGLDFDSLSGPNPGLVYCSITGFGQDGPAAPRAGYDVMIQAMSGLMSITGAADGPPQKVGVAVVDLFAGTYAATAILAALRQRDLTGRGQRIDIALFDVGLAMCANQAMNYLATGTAPGRLGNAHPNLAPYEPFDCADGQVVIAVGNDRQFARLCALLGLDAAAADPLYATNADRVARREALHAVLMQATRGWSRAALLAACEDEGIPAGPINDIAEAFAEPQAVHRGLRVEADGVPQVRSPFRFSSSGTPEARPAPALGEADAEIRARQAPDR